MDVPRDARDVGWLASGPQPGQPGDAVIDGHLDWVSGPAVFWNLGKLRAGDSIQVVDGEGHAITFQVATTASYPADQPPPANLFSNAGRPRLSLTTCAGDWNGIEYSKRLVVEATPAAAGG
jgi:sortase (surface protein transpeptidase)